MGASRYWNVLCLDLESEYLYKYMYLYIEIYKVYIKCTSSTL